jgi:hypothetical protein
VNSAPRAITCRKRKPSFRQTAWGRLIGGAEPVNSGARETQLHLHPADFKQLHPSRFLVIFKLAETNTQCPENTQAREKHFGQSHPSSAWQHREQKNPFRAIPAPHLSTECCNASRPHREQARNTISSNHSARSLSTPSHRMSISCWFLTMSAHGSKGLAGVSVSSCAIAAVIWAAGGR